MVLTFSLLRVNGRELEALAELENFEHGWEVRAKLHHPEDLRYLVGLFATSSESVALEVEAPDRETLKLFKGEAKLAGVPVDPAAQIRFVGVRAVTWPEIGDEGPERE